MNYLILCSSKLAIPAIFTLHQQNKNVLVLCYAQTVEVEEEFKLLAKSLKLTISFLDTTTWKDTLQKTIRDFNPKALLVMTFSFKIPDSILNLLPKRVFNFHYALLPKYRGSFPLFQILTNNESFGGVTVHHMTEEWDKGDIVMQQYVPIKKGETYGKHETDLSNTGAELANILVSIMENEDLLIPAIPQNEDEANYIEKPGIEELSIKWNSMRAEEIVTLILSTNPWCKGAISFWNGLMVQLLYARITDKVFPNGKPGEIMELDYTNGMVVCAADKKGLIIDIVYKPDEGYVPAFTLVKSGLRKGIIAT